MYIVFFDYDGKRYYFGVTLGCALTLCSTSYAAVVAALAQLQRDELDKDSQLGSPGPLMHIKALVQENLVVKDAGLGVTETVPHAEGMVSLFVNVVPPAYFAAPAEDPTFISVVDGPDGALNLAQIRQAGTSPAR